MLIPVIKIKDNGREHIVGSNYRDQLYISNNAIHYENLQCGVGTEYPGESNMYFTGIEPSDYEPYATIEMVTLEEWLKLDAEHTKIAVKHKLALDKFFKERFDEIYKLKDCETHSTSGEVI